jgi:hypothetical protein
VDGLAIAGFRLCEQPRILGSELLYYRAAVFDVAHHPRAAALLGNVWPVLPHISDVLGHQLEYGQWLDCGMLCLGCVDSHQKLISVSIIPDASVGNSLAASGGCASSGATSFPYRSAFHFTIGSVSGSEHFSLRRSCGGGGRLVMCNGTGLLILQPDLSAGASPPSAPSSSDIMFPYTLTAPCGGVRATWVDIFNQLSLHSSWPTHKTPSLKWLDSTCDLVSWKRPSPPDDAAAVFIVSVVVLCRRAPGAHVSAGYSQPAAAAAAVEAAAAAAVEAASHSRTSSDNGPTCFVRCLCVGYDARNASIRFSKTWAEHEAPPSQTKITADERVRRLVKLRHKNAGQLHDCAGGWEAFDMQPINTRKPLQYLDSKKSPWRLQA